VLQCVAVCCSVLQCVAVCCSVLQCVAVCCRALPVDSFNIHICIVIHVSQYDTHIPQYDTHIPQYDTHISQYAEEWLVQCSNVDSLNVLTSFALPTSILKKSPLFGGFLVSCASMEWQRRGVYMYACPQMDTHTHLCVYTMSMGWLCYGMALTSYTIHATSLPSHNKPLIAIP